VRPANYMSANKAAIAAGFRKQLSPAELAAKAVGNLTDSEWEKLKRQEDRRREATCPQGDKGMPLSLP
jgi:hypothetical protein